MTQTATTTTLAPGGASTSTWGASWTVACPCGVDYDDGEEMIECDECNVWVHTACARVDPTRCGTFRCARCRGVPDTPLGLKREHEGGRGDSDEGGGERALKQGTPQRTISRTFSSQLWKSTGLVPKSVSLPREYISNGNGTPQQQQALTPKVEDTSESQAGDDSNVLDHAAKPATPKLGTASTPTPALVERNPKSMKAMAVAEYMRTANKKKCANCHTSNTPMWRKGFSGDRAVTLCNACGLRFKKNKFCPFCYHMCYENDDPDNANNMNSGRDSPWLGCTVCGRWVHKSCHQQHCPSPGSVKRLRPDCDLRLEPNASASDEDKAS
eukprot:jgi/Chlat1/8196/Chrsp76S07628